MKIKTLFIINAVIAIVFGVVFVIIPAQVYSLYGVESNSQLSYMGQLFGVALIGFGLLTWNVRNAADSDARRTIIFALLISYSIGFVVVLIGQLNDVVNELGWSTVAIYCLLAIGFGYFQFKKSG
ncbi:hypothetical protein ACFLS9_00710 [Bacteroidota bacterium]